jgi:hypothetical protein
VLALQANQQDAAITHVCQSIFRAHHIQAGHATVSPWLTTSTPLITPQGWLLSSEGCIYKITRWRPGVALGPLALCASQFSDLKMFDLSRSSPLRGVARHFTAMCCSCCSRPAQQHASARTGVLQHCSCRQPGMRCIMLHVCGAVQ